jgi:electron transport complex protein RnfB
MTSTVLISLLSMGGLGLLLGGGLAIASKKLAVETDPKVEAVLNLLPGANCGGCGFPGCAGLAKAIVEGKAAVNSCNACSQANAEKIAELVGASAAAKEKAVARVMCQGSIDKAKLKSEYQGIKTCRAASMVNGGPKMCPFGCIGFGDCAAVCPFNAITIGDYGLPIIDEQRCTGCGICVKECPKSVIKLTPAKNEVHVRCQSNLKGKEVRKSCDIGCIGCKQCEKACPFDAIHVVDNVAVIDYEKCRNCMKCVEKCPTRAITSAFSQPKKAVINDKCVGCTLCAKKCPVGAISGEVKQKHVVDPEKCIGCSICAENCRVNAISFVRTE